MNDWTRIVGHLTEGTLLEWAGLLALLVGIGVAVWWAMRYRASLRDDADRMVADHQLANHVQEMYERGEISSEEYRSLTNRVQPQGEGAESPPADQHGEPLRGDYD